MKRIFLLLTFALILSPFAFTASAQSRTNRIYRNCPGTTTKAAVAIDVAGNITVTPCSGKTVITNGVKVYRALLTQTGTNAPVATVLENSLGGTVVWTYAGAGSYVGTLVSAFPATKTLATSQVEFADTAIITFTRSGDNTIAVGAAGDDMLVAFGIQILVYP